MTGRGAGKSHHLSTGTQTLIDDEHKYSRACFYSARHPLSVPLCVCGETLRLALCGPDYNGISAAAYYTGL